MYSSPTLVFLTEILLVLVSNCLSDTPQWNILVLAQIWPPASCFYLEQQHETCQIPADIESWTVHGLWPTEKGTGGPNFCNDTWKFNIEQVQVLRPALDANWPSFSVQEPSPDNWKHEWEKHGTCGTSVSELKDEVNYFNTTLKLHQKYNLQSLLASRGILPSSSTTYSPDAISKALNDILGVDPIVICVEDKGLSYLETVEICMSRDFQLLDCPAAGLDFKKQKHEGNLVHHPENQMLRRMSVSSSEDCRSSGVYYKPFTSL